MIEECGQPNHFLDLIRIEVLNHSHETCLYVCDSCAEKYPDHVFDAAGCLADVEIG